MKPSERAARDLAKSLGLTVLDCSQTRGNHLRMRVGTPQGNTFSTIFALTPSDHRALANQRAFMKRQLKEVDQCSH